jgi:formylglycine-generating enzyme required for sulfatase activity
MKRFVLFRELIASTVLLLLPAQPTSAEVATFGSGANQFTVDFVTIGNPGNPADATSDPNPAGSVPYVYRIGKYEISREMIEKANAAGGLGLTLDPMDFVSGSLGSGPRPAMPATGMSWNEAARFTNWLNTSKGFPAAYKFSVQAGEPGYSANANIEVWQAGDAGYDANNLFRNGLAYYFLPSVDEWYKAAYFDPNANGGAGRYWDYQSGSDTLPSPVASGTDLGTAVYFQEADQGPADITLAGGLSPNGTMAQGGNVWEWQETEGDGINDDASSCCRALSGSGWYSSDIFGGIGDQLRHTLDGDVLHEHTLVGFRVASIPEPSSLLVGVLGLLGLLIRRRSV